ncbi:MAG: radical SAM protein [bacterium]
MIPALAQWEISDKCQYRCQHCYYTSPEEVSLSPGILNDEQMWQIANIIVYHQLFFVTFTGGEPLVISALLVQLAKYLHEHNVSLSLNTNLALMNESLFADLHVDRMLISCPATDPSVYREVTGNGNYHLFEQKLKLLIEADANFTVNMVVSKLNHLLIRETASHLANLGVKRFAATPTSINPTNPNFSLLLDLNEVQQVIFDLIWAYEELGLEVDIMESIPKCVMPLRAFELELPFVYRSCHAGKRNGTISANGDVRPCGHNPRVFGNILTDKVETIWNRMHDWREASGNFHTDCLGCDIFSNCGGGCRVDAATREGETAAKHPYMTHKLTAPPVKPKEITLLPDTVIRPSRSFHFRSEDGGWLVAPGSPRNIIHVNQVLYEFLVSSRDLNPMPVAELATKYNTTANDYNFQRVLNEVIKKKFFVIM